MIDLKSCGGFHVKPVEEFYAITFQEHYKFFGPRYVDETLGRIAGSSVAHIWNKLNAKIPLSVDTEAAYIHIAKKFCPLVLQASDIF